MSIGRSIAKAHRKAWNVNRRLWANLGGPAAVAALRRAWAGAWRGAPSEVLIDLLVSLTIGAVVAAELFHYCGAK